MNLTDTHTHLYLGEFEKDRHEVVKRAIDSGIVQLLLPNIDSGSVDGMLELVESFPGICRPMIGLHPGSVDTGYREELRRIESWFCKEKFIAIGEIGIDLYRDRSFKEQQLEAFKIQIQWARELNLPIIIHARESFNEIFNILDRFMDDKLKGVFHSFTGNEDHVSVIQGYGFYFGINGIVTYKNSELAKIVSHIPVDKILLETDSPYLTPVPNRGKRNESSNLIFIARRLADIYNLPLEKLASITTGNADKLFKLK